MNHKYAKAYIAAFVLMIGSPYLLMLLFSGHIDRESSEKRKLAEFPSFSLQTVSEYPDEMEAYVNDHLPFRSQLVEWNSALKYYLFHISEGKAISGKDGWLFYSDASDGNPIAAYKGRNLLTAEELQKIRGNLTVTQENLQKKGIEFVLYIVPDKERVYSEYMPDYLGEPAENYPVLQLVNDLREHTDLAVVYPYEEIMDDKERLGSETLLYHKTDTHWNGLGAYAGTLPLLRQLGINLPAVQDPQISITRSEDSLGDLAQVLNLTSLNPGYTFQVSGYTENSFSRDKYDFSTEYRYHAEDADPRKLFVVRDSFGTNMADILGSQFAATVMVHTRAFQNDMIDKEAPDIVVLELVERRVRALKSFRYE